MTTRQKFDVHLEMVIWEDTPEGTILNAAQVQTRMEHATPAQRHRAFWRGQKHIPFFLDDEIAVARAITNERTKP